MRPRFYDAEILFLLEMLRDVEAKLNRQILNLAEEQEYLWHHVPALRSQWLREGDRLLLKRSKECAVRLAYLNEWLPSKSKRRELLRRLILRLEKLKKHKRGRIPSVYKNIFVNQDLVSSFLKE